MAIKPGGGTCNIREQIIEDPVSGLTFQFSIIKGTSAPFRLKVFGNIPNSNREIVFDQEGEMTGAGTLLVGACRPSWLSNVG